MSETEKFFGGVNSIIGFVKWVILIILFLICGIGVSQTIFHNSWGVFAIFGLVAVYTAVHSFREARKQR